MVIGMWVSKSYVDDVLDGRDCDDNWIIGYFF